MIKTNGAKTTVKIIDFGLAIVHKPEDPPLTAFAGSAFTIAPEVIQRQYGREVDLWSVGIITYFLLTHLMPFNAHSNEEMFKKIQSGVFYYPRWAKDGLSANAKDFIERLLIVNPKKRMTAKQALSHKWVRQFYLSASQTDLALAVVLYNHENEASPGDAKKDVQNKIAQGRTGNRIHREDQNRSSAIVLYNDRKPRHSSKAAQQGHQLSRQRKHVKHSDRKDGHKHKHQRSTPRKEDSRDEKEKRDEKKKKPHRRHVHVDKSHRTSDEPQGRRKRH